MKSAALAFALAAALWGIPPFAALAQNSPVSIVRISSACTLPAARGVAEGYVISVDEGNARWGQAITRSWCLSFLSRITVRVLEVLAPRYVDGDGDGFYVVRVGNPDQHGYSFAWPGRNSSLVQTQGFAI